MAIPRVLIISNNSFSNVFNNGKTLEALFFSLPKENLAQLFFHEGSLPDFSFCENYWKISEIDLIKSLRYGKKCIGNKVDDVTVRDNSISKSYPRFLQFIKDKTGNLFRDVLWRFVKWESPAFKQWINVFNPDLLFFVGSSAAFSSRIALKLSSEFSLPLAVYYTDDYLFSLSRNTILERIKYNRVKRLYNRVIKNSSAQFVIGNLMADEYSQFFNKTFNPIMNSVSIESYEEPKIQDSITIAYFGGLHLNRWKMLSRLSSLLPHNCSLHVYTAPENITEEVVDVFEKTGVVYKGVLSGAALKEEMKQADVLLHVESDDKDNRRFTRLAISTKIPEYLATGRPVLGFGPSEVASMKILSDNKVGMVVSSDDNNDIIKDKLDGFLGDFQSRKVIGLRGYEFAKKIFDKKKNSDRIIEILSGIIKHNTR